MTGESMSSGLVTPDGHSYLIAVLVHSEVWKKKAEQQLSLRAKASLGRNYCLREGKCHKRLTGPNWDGETTWPLDWTAKETLRWPLLLAFTCNYPVKSRISRLLNATINSAFFQNIGWNIQSKVPDWLFSFVAFSGSWNENFDAETHIRDTKQEYFNFRISFKV